MGTMNSEMFSRHDSLKQEAPLEVMSHMGIEDCESEQKDSFNCEPGDDRNSGIEFKHQRIQPIGDVISEDGFNETPFEGSSYSLSSFSARDQPKGPRF
jgi:hypothetical protein